jgi:hypothetical protein
MATASYEIPKLEVAAFDTRLQSRHIAQGRISPKDVEKHLKGLSDDADNGEFVTVYLGEDPPAAETEEV